MSEDDIVVAGTDEDVRFAENVEHVLVRETDGSDEKLLIYHDPEQFGGVHGVTTIPREDAIKRGAVACSHCFVKGGHGPRYQYPYNEQ